MKLPVFLIAGLFALLSSCSRSSDCGCVPPPVTETHWKLSRIFGGFAPAERDMSDDQKNSILTITSTGQYTCKNTVTGITTTGGIIQEQHSSGLTKYTFSPLLRIYPATSFLVIERTADQLVLSDGNPDGYQLTFLKQ